MSRAYSDIAFTPAVRAMQTRMGSRSGYASLDHTKERRDTLTQAEIAFIHARDGFYQATVGETGWPYVQFRGGPTGFLKAMFDTLATLPPNQARAFILRHWHEETSSDICIKPGVTTANLHVTLHRARSRLRVLVSAGFTWSARPACAPAPQYRTEAGSLRPPLPALAA